MGADRERIRKRIHSLIGSDKSHDIESAPYPLPIRSRIQSLSAPYPLPIRSLLPLAVKDLPIQSEAQKSAPESAP